VQGSDVYTTTMHPRSPKTQRSDENGGRQRTGETWTARED
jgi:hypothetical protein